MIKLNARRFLLVTTATLLVGCTGSKEKMFPDDLPTMKEIYDRHFDKIQRGNTGTHTLRRTATVRGIPVAGSELYAYTRDSHNELALRFPRLPNPQWYLYVDPHLTATGQPIPGYVTEYPLYDTVEFALPGEVPPLPPSLPALQPPLGYPNTAQYLIPTSAPPTVAPGKKPSPSRAQRTISKPMIRGER